MTDKEAIALISIVTEMRTIAMVASQCSVEGEPDVRHAMAAAESGRCSEWAHRIETIVEKAVAHD